MVFEMVQVGWLERPAAVFIANFAIKFTKLPGTKLKLPARSVNTVT